MELTVGPLLFNWSADAWSDLYARIADEAPVDRVVLGEVVCSKRLPFYADRIPAASERLKRAGKQVVLASLEMVTLPRERRDAAALVTGAEDEVEINDLTALRWTAPERPFSVGPLVNVYNESSLGFLAKRGARGICLPPELPFASVQILAQAAKALDVRLEVWAFGRVPLAIAGRCYHARVHGLSKDSCQFVCDRDSDGLRVETLDRQAFLAVNGVQTLSHNCACLAGDIPALAAAGVTSLRLSPHSGDFPRVATLFREVIEGRRPPAEAQAEVGEAMPPMPLSRGFLFEASGAVELG